MRSFRFPGFRLTNSMEAFSKNTPLEVKEGKLEIAAINLEAGNSTIKITKIVIRLAFYTLG